MINGAVEIIAGVPGKHLDPLLLAQSQTTDSINFMLIAYEIPSHLAQERFFDLLFLRGSRIFDCARMNQDLRYRLQVERVISTFKQRWVTMEHGFIYIKLHTIQWNSFAQHSTMIHV